jgi:Flp pilus assembly pilin Flp
MNLCVRFWANEEGFVVSSELILIATLLVLGMITGLDTIRDQVIQELADVGDAVSEINQSYSFSGVTAHSASTAGSVFVDLSDYCEQNGLGQNGDQSTTAEPQCIEISSIAADLEDAP